VRILCIEAVRILCIIVFMHENIPSFTELLKNWDSDEAAANDLAVSRYCARQWRTRNRMRPEYWPRFIEALDRRFAIKITADDLMLASAQGGAKQEPDCNAEAA
jgi:DNA-directed RNA polymerase subunit N (RpoN/RPB10)